MFFPRLFTLFTTLLAVAASGTKARSQTTDAAVHGSPPKFLNLVREQLKPGRSTARTALETELVSDFTRANIPAYWLEAERSGEEILALNFVNSFEEFEGIVNGLTAGYANHPEILGKVDHMLQENISAVNTVFTVRRDDLGYQAKTVDFSKARILWLTTFQVRPGHEAEFAEANRAASTAYEKLGASTAWVVYEVNDGLPSPSFVFLMPLRSLSELGEAIATRQKIENEDGASGARLQELARNAYTSVKTDIFYVNPRCSHLPDDFTNGDPDFWAAKPEPTHSKKSRR